MSKTKTIGCFRPYRPNHLLDQRRRRYKKTVWIRHQKRKENNRAQESQNDI